MSFIIPVLFVTRGNRYRVYIRFFVKKKCDYIFLIFLFLTILMLWIWTIIENSSESVCLKQTAVSRKSIIAKKQQKKHKKKSSAEMQNNYK